MTATNVFPGILLPGTRFGTYGAPSYMPGYLYATPASSDASATAMYQGSWLQPDRRHCNPLGWLVTTKRAFSHTGMPFANDLEKKSGFWLAKTTLCLNANCTASDGSHDASCPPKKCYASKSGACVQFNTNVFPKYLSQQTQAHVKTAAEQFAAGNYVECGETAHISTISMIAGN